MTLLRRHEIQASDSPSIDAFGRWRVANPETLFDSQHQYNESDTFWAEKATSGGTATHLPNESSVRLRVDTTSGASIIRQTYEYFRYQPGKSQLIFCTFVMGSANTNVEKWVGYGDAQNGFFVYQSGAGAISLVKRTYISGSAVDNSVAQASWNIDPFDGTGPSGVTLDFTKSQIFIVDMEWLGVGRVRTGFVVDGAIYYAHEFLHANVLATVYVTTANLPIRYEIKATGVAGGTTDLIQVCSTVISEGGAENQRSLNWASSSGGVTARTISAETCVVSIRPKATFNSIVNRGKIVLTGVTVFVSTADTVYWELVWGAAIGGTPAWNSVGANSIVEKDIAGTTRTGGEVIDCGYLGATVQGKVPEDKTVNDKRPITLDIDGVNPISVSLVITPFSAPADVHGAINWREVW